MEGLVISQTPAADPSKPADAEVFTRVDTGGRTQYRVVARPAEVPDPAAPKKPEEKKSEEKKSATDGKPETPAPEAPKAEGAPKRPEWLPEKFKTPDEMKAATIELAKKQNAPAYVIRGLEASESGAEVSAAYAEFEKHIDPNAGKPKEPAAEPPKPVVKTEEEKKYEVEALGPAVAALLDKAGLRSRDLEEMYVKTGKVTDEVYAKFAEVGVSKAFLDNFMGSIAGTAKALAETHVAEIKGSVGGPEKFDEMARWAAGHMAPADVEVYNKMTSSGDLAVVKKAVSWLKGEFEKANGKPPALITETKPAGGPDGDVYGSWAEVKVDMADPRYKGNDPAFHKKVDAKLSRSKL